MSKRGFGMPQVLGVLIVLLVGLAYILTSYLLAGSEEQGRAPTAEQDFANQQAHLMLMGFLRAPIEESANSSALFDAVQEPIVADMISYYGADESVRAEYSRVAKELFSSDAKLLFEIDDEVVVVMGEDPRETRRVNMFEFERSCEESIGEAAAPIPSGPASSDRVVEIINCGVGS